MRFQFLFILALELGGFDFGGRLCGAVSTLFSEIGLEMGDSTMVDEAGCRRWWSSSMELMFDCLVVCRCTLVGLSENMAG